MPERRINVHFGKKERDMLAFDYLNSLDMSRWKSKNRFIIEAIVFFAEYLEGRRRQEDFVKDIVDGVVRALRTAPVLMISGQSSGNDPQNTSDNVSEEDEQAGLDFLDM